MTELPERPLRFRPKTSRLAENGHQSAEFRQARAKGSLRHEKREPSNSLICQQIKNISRFSVWHGSCHIETGRRCGVRQWTSERGGP
jgi:hypothetical protein